MKVYFQGSGLLKDVTNYVTSFSTTAEMKSGRLIGNAISLMVDISFNNLTGILNGAATGDFYIDVRQSDSGTPTQKFTVMDAPERYTSKLKLTMYDNMVKLNSPYKSSYAYVEGGYPTIAQQLAEIAALADVAFNTEWLPDAVLNKTAYWIDTTVNMREYVARIAELAGCNAYVNSANQICFKRLLADHFTAAFASDFDKYDLLTITQVVYDDGLIRYAAGSSSSGKTMYLSPDNAYIDSQEAVDAVFDLYDGASFCPLATMKTFGQDGMMPGCLVTYDSIPCIVTSVKRAYHGEGSSVVLNGSVSNENGDKVTVVNDRTRIKQIRTILDQEAGKLQILAEDVEESSTRIGKLEVSAQGISSTVSSMQSTIEDIQETQDETIWKTEIWYISKPEGTVPSKNDQDWASYPPARTEGNHIWSMMVTETVGGTVTKHEPVDQMGYDGQKGEDATLIKIDSSRGNVFKNNQISTDLTITVYHGASRITNITELRNVYGSSAHLRWFWKRMDDDDFREILATDDRLYNDGFLFVINSDDVDSKVVFDCRVDDGK